MVLSIKNENKNDKLFAFLLGLSVSEGISAVFSFGNTFFTIAEVFSPILLLFLCLRDTKGITSFIRNVPFGFKLLFIAIVGSIIPGLAYFMSASIIYRYCVGIIYLLIALTTAINAFILRESKNAIIKGLYIGLVGNVLYTILCYVAFQSGTVITLTHFIHRAGFYAPTASFRSQGFFLEPSHFIRYVGTVGLLVISSTKMRHSLIKYSLVLAAVIALVLSYSGSLAILAIGFVLYWSGTRDSVNFGRARPRTLALIFVVLLISIFAMDGFDINEYYDFEGAFSRIINGADITDEGNTERFESMQTILGNLGSIMLGCGWNLTGTFIQTENLGITAAFSDILELLLEIGVVGVLLYVGSAVALSLSLWKTRDRYSRALSVTLLVILALQIGTDYALNTCIMLTFGLSIGQLSDRRFA